MFLAVSFEGQGGGTIAVENRSVEILQLAVVEIVGVIGYDVGDELVGGDAYVCVVGDTQCCRFGDLLYYFAAFFLVTESFDTLVSAFENTSSNN